MALNGPKIALKLDLQGNSHERQRQRCGCLTENVLHAVAGGKGEAFAGQEDKLRSIGKNSLKVRSLGRIITIYGHITLDSTPY